MTPSDVGMVYGTSTLVGWIEAKVAVNWACTLGAVIVTAGGVDEL